MYYPFFRARQFELIALRELVIENEIQGFVTPILEPVNDTISNLDIAYKIFRDGKQDAFIVVNSKKGKLSGDDEIFLEYLSKQEDNTYKVAFHYENNSPYILYCINKYALTGCMLLCKNDIDSDDGNFRLVTENAGISFFTIDNPGKNRSLSRYLTGLNKSIIRLDDCFEKQIRNSDFLLMPEHRFSEEHLWYISDRYNGFADYTALPSEYIEGGNTPRAVVIHLTFLKTNDEIWIRHFTSITNDTISDVQGKFGEAATKAVQFIRDNSITNSATIELEKYFDDQHYPGLGMVKKISIKNHLLVVSSYLKRRP